LFSIVILTAAASERFITSLLRAKAGPDVQTSKSPAKAALIKNEIRLCFTLGNCSGIQAAKGVLQYAPTLEKK